MAWLRLNPDPAAVNRENRRNDHYGNSEEVFFKVAKLNEKSSLHISQQSTGVVCGCGVTHVKLIPLSPEEVQAAAGGPPRPVAPHAGGHDRRVLHHVLSQSAAPPRHCSRKWRYSAIPTSAR